MSTFWRNILSQSSGLKWPCLEMDIYIRARIGPEEEKVACSLLKSAGILIKSKTSTLCQKN
jgi:hypothetical protein